MNEANGLSIIIVVAELNSHSISLTLFCPPLGVRELYSLRVAFDCWALRYILTVRTLSVECSVKEEIVIQRCDAIHVF